MTRPRSRLLIAFLLLAVAAGVGAHRFAVQQDEDLARHHDALARLESEIRHVRHQLEASQRELSEIERDTAHARAAATAREASPPHLWAARVVLMRQLLEEMPAQKIPELKLLTLLDWIQVASIAELDTANRIRAAFVALRGGARRRMSEKLQTALRSFLAASDGELPADVRQLAAHMSGPAAEPSMLARYEMIRSGMVGVNDEPLIREKPSSDAILTVSLHGFSVAMNSEFPEVPDDSVAHAAERFSGLLEGAFDHKGDEMKKVLMPLWEVLPRIIEKYQSQVGAIFGENPDEVFKAVGARYRAANPGITPEHAGQLLPYFPNPEGLIAVARLAFAEIEYLRTHHHVAPDAVALQPFLSKPFDIESALRAVKVSFEGEKMTWTYSWSSSETSVGHSPSKATGPPAP